MAKIIGIGGVFYKADDPSGTAAWYQDVLGLPAGEGFDGSIFAWRRTDDPDTQEMTVFSMFKADTEYMQPSDRPFMINFITDDIEGMLRKLKDSGAKIVGEIVDEPYGRFAWFIDPSGAKMELGEPARPPST